MNLSKIARYKALALLASAASVCAPAPAAAQEAGSQAARQVTFDIEAKDLGEALTDFALQSGVEVLYNGADVRGKRSNRLRGAYTPVQAIRILLAGSGVPYVQNGDGTLLIGTGALGTANLSEQAIETRRGLPETIVVTGSRNAGIRRFEDDAQPYVVFSEEEIEDSFASDLEEFFKTRLPMNAIQTTYAQETSNTLFGNQSQINLRGLGTNQTLILVNGRRQPAVSDGSGFTQPDINGIPLSAIERIEVLPTTAAGIYGGGATGGVINIILKRDYTGIEITAGYDNAFDTDVAQRRFEANAGFSLEDGRTSITMSASYSDSNELLVGDRDFARRGRALLLANNPDSFFLSGTPPIGFTTNIRSATGSDLVLDDGTPLDSPFTFVPVGYAGPGSDGGQALVANAGQYNLDLSDGIKGRRASLLNNPTVQSYSLNARREFTDWLEIFAEGSYYSNQGRGRSAITTLSFFLPDSAPSNPFQSGVVAAIPFVGLSTPQLSETETYNGLTGAIVELPGSWVGEVEYAASKSRTTSSYYFPALMPAFDSDILDGEIDIFRDLNQFPIDFQDYVYPDPTQITGPLDTRLNALSARVSGTLLNLPAGAVVLSTRLEHRQEEIEEAFQDSFDFVFDPVEGFILAPITIYAPNRSQAVDSVYLETIVPVFSDRNGRSGLKQLELQFAIRRDSYETVAPKDFLTAQAILPSREETPPVIEMQQVDVSSTDVTLGVRYIPFGGLLLRASYGTGFLPPAISQIVPAFFTNPFLGRRLIDPKRGGVRGTNTRPIAETRFGNPDLEPEQSESFSVGAIMTPRFADGVRFSVDYTRIKKTNEIVAALTTNNIFDFEEAFPDRVTRAPLTPEDEAAGFAGGEVIGLDTSPLNVATSTVEAFDFQLDYQRNTRFGSVRAYALATLQTSLATRILPDTPTIDRVGSTDGPLRWRGNVGLTWDKGPWSLGWNAQYYDSYLVYSSTAPEAAVDMAVLNQGAAKIPSQMYHDVYASYRLERPGSLRWLNRAEIRLGIQNVFNESPPILAIFSGVGGYSTYGDPRLRRYSILLRTSF